jgi:hypothetical protein
MDDLFRGFVRPPQFAENKLGIELKTLIEDTCRQFGERSGIGC